MNTTEKINDLAMALAKAQGAYLPLPKDREVTVNGKNAAGNPISYKFKYATLDAVFDSTRKALSDNGLCIVQPPTNGENGIVVTTRLIHESGQWIEESLEFSTVAVKPQDLGSLITYAKRYLLTGILGITADEDDDASAAAGHERELGTTKGKPSPKSNGRKPAAKKPEFSDLPPIERLKLTLPNIRTAEGVARCREAAQKHIDAGTMNAADGAVASELIDGREAELDLQASATP